MAVNESDNEHDRAIRLSVVVASVGAEMSLSGGGGGNGNSNEMSVLSALPEII